MAYSDIKDPSAYFQTKLYTGTGSNLVITNDGNSDLQPDFIWIKQRNTGQHHNIYDSNRGATTMLYPNLTNAEYSTGESLKSFNTDGFTVGNYGTVGTSGGTYVAWQWKANAGSTSSNTDGTITSTVQANTDAGFSIVTYTGTGSAGTIGHGLGVAPKVVIVKARTGVPTSWAVFHKDGSTSDDDTFVLNSNAAKATYAGFWNNQYPSSSVFGISNDIWLNGNTENFVAYCFAEKQGCSKFGSYVGNGVANNGPFVHLGFKPRFIMIKSTTTTGSHVIWDSKRSPFNGMDDYLVAAEADAEGTNGIFTIDAVSNGFKIRNTGANNGLNQSGTKYIYYAFAENPFVAGGIPTTAR